MPEPLTTDEKKAFALELVLDAWDKALSNGVEPELLASVAIYAALADMVDNYGVEPVAEMCEELPARVRAGEFTLSEEDDEYTDGKGN
ncbi:MAG: hypothetical protein ABW199_07035 [Caulobacterales bacterium]